MRTLKPEFWTDDVIVELTPWARLFYMGCWNFAICDQGHLDGTPKSLKLKILPADPVDANEIVDELIDAGRLVRKQTPDGRTYHHIATLSKHSKTDTRWSTRCEYCALEGSTKPVSAPPATDNLTETQESLGEPTETQPSKGRESKGRESKGESARKRGTRIPDDFAIDDEMRQWARSKCPGVALERETEKFANYWRSETGAKAAKLDWTLTWKNWILRAADYQPSRASPQPAYEPSYLLPLGGAP